MSAIDDYYAALDRLKQNKPQNLDKGVAINKDTVALEAGRKRGAIRNRTEFQRLLKDIEGAAQQSQMKAVGGGNRYKRNAANLKAKLEVALHDKDVAQSRYMSLLYQNHMLKTTLDENGLKSSSVAQVIDFDVKGLEIDW